ncbi:MAG: tyrosine--tRNA ligase [Patescibacteria group bacterium]|nr:tyrosine--tRNA ligase [Patescibacteria group bacterium]MDE1945757.1 tyrosine--tRNA ligase [Patescibacteria group bacterium]
MVNTDSEKIEEILTRSIQTILPSKDAFKKELLSGKRLRIYVGADATGSKLHIGHATNFMILERLRQLGHEVIILFGDFTAMIGDPTGKDKERRTLTKKEVESNLKTWKNQVSKIVKIGNFNNGAKIVRNSSWFSKMNFADVVGLASHFTLQQMVERDMFQKRLEEKKPIFLHEFFYPLMQGYDSVVLDVDVEIGGNDQTFNMLAGRTLQKIKRNKEKFVVATTLLINPKTGKKLMNKSEGIIIGLDDEYNDMFGKVMALPDETIISVFIDCTYVSLNEIEKIRKALESGANPRDAKMRLAKEIVTIYHGEEKGEKAEQNFIETFKKGGVPEGMQEVKAENEKPLSEILLGAKIVESKSDFRRLVLEGAVSDAVSGEKITDPNYKISKNITLKIGKKRFVKIVL